MEISRVYLWWWFTLPTRQQEVVVWFCGSFSFCFWEQIDIWHLAVTKSRCACALMSSFNKKETGLCHPCVAITKKKRTKKRGKKIWSFFNHFFYNSVFHFFLRYSATRISEKEYDKESGINYVLRGQEGGKKTLSRATPVCKFRKTKTELKFT